MNLLIPYIYRDDHKDPLFEEFTYGDINRRGRKLQKHVSKGDYLFFHIGIGGSKYITAYYVVDFVLSTEEAVKNKDIVAKYNNPHISRWIYVFLVFLFSCTVLEAPHQSVPESHSKVSLGTD